MLLPRQQRTRAGWHCAELCIYPSACHWKIKEEAEVAAAASASVKAKEVIVEPKHVQVHVLPLPNPHGNQHEARQAATFDFLPSDRKGTCVDDDDDDDAGDSISPTELAPPTIEPAGEKRKSTSSAFARFWVKTAAQLGGLLSPSTFEGDIMRGNVSSRRGLDLPVFKRLRERQKEWEEAMVLDEGGVGGVEDVAMTDMVSPVSEGSQRSGDSSSSDEEVEWEGVGRAYGGWRVSN